MHEANTTNILAPGTTAPDFTLPHSGLVLREKGKGERNGNEATYLFHRLSQSEDDS